MSCEDCAYWGHGSCKLPCQSKVPRKFEIYGLLIEPKTTNKIKRDSRAIFVSAAKVEFREYCESENELALLDLFCFKLLGKQIVNLDGEPFTPELRNKQLFLVPKSWETQYKILERHYRALAKNGFDRGIAYARKVTRCISARQITNKESFFLLLFLRKARIIHTVEFEIEHGTIITVTVLFEKRKVSVISRS